MHTFSSCVMKKKEQDVLRVDDRDPFCLDELKMKKFSERVVM